MFIHAKSAIKQPDFRYPFVPELPPKRLSLSKRQVQLLGLLEMGYSNQQIAEHLGLTVGTIKQHLNRLFKKINVKNRLQAVTYWQKNHRC